MSTVSKSAFSALALSLMSIGAAHADVIDMAIGGANIYTLGNFTAASTLVQGSVVVAGDFSSTLTTINYKKDNAYSNYSLVVGGKLSESLTNLGSGKYYAGGKVSSLLSTSGGKSKTLPLNFASTSAALSADSVTLNALADTGTTSKSAFNTLDFKTSGSGTQVFDVSAATLETASSYSFGTLAKGSTVIINVSGSTAVFSGLTNYSAFSNYNVLFNFEDATSITMGLGLDTFYGNILATKADFNGVTGTIDGNVVVDNWNSTLSMSVLSAPAFSAVLPGAPLAAAVPEPETYAMLAAGLGLMGFMVSRKRKAA